MSRIDLSITTKPFSFSFSQHSTDEKSTSTFIDTSTPQPFSSRQPAQSFNACTLFKKPFLLNITPHTRPHRIRRSNGLKSRLKYTFFALSGMSSHTLSTDRPHTTMQSRLTSRTARFAG